MKAELHSLAFKALLSPSVSLAFKAFLCPLFLFVTAGFPASALASGFVWNADLHFTHTLHCQPG